jgi:RNase H-fold protein (predicted Holliday junction resolvase)
MKFTNLFFSLALAYFLIFGDCVAVLAQNENKKNASHTPNDFDNVVMTWNKNTPEAEMNDDVNALKKYGVSIHFSDVKRNSKNEITGLKVSYEDESGNKGKMEINHQMPISTITFYKSGNQIGFGTPDENPLTQLQLMDEEGNPVSEFFGNNYFDRKKTLNPSRKSKIIIKKPNKSDLIIENGEVIAGKEDYTPDEIEKIKKEAQINSNPLGNSELDQVKEFDLREEKGVREFMEKIKRRIPFNENEVDEKSALAAAKEELIKAKEELEKARLALEKVAETKTKKK